MLRVHVLTVQCMCPATWLYVASPKCSSYVVLQVNTSPWRMLFLYIMNVWYIICKEHLCLVMLFWTLSSSISKTVFFFKHWRAFSFVIDLYAVLFFLLVTRCARFERDESITVMVLKTPFTSTDTNQTADSRLIRIFSHFGCFIKENVGQPVNKIIITFILSLGWFTHRRSRSCSVGEKNGKTVMPS